MKNSSVRALNQTHPRLPIFSGAREKAIVVLNEQVNEIVVIPLQKFPSIDLEPLGKRQGQLSPRNVIDRNLKPAPEIQPQLPVVVVVSVRSLGVGACPVLNTTPVDALHDFPVILVQRTRRKETVDHEGLIFLDGSFHMPPNLRMLEEGSTSFT
jgi:hypothetical protein